MRKLPQFLRKEFASVLACLVPHVQIDRADKDHYIGQRYVVPTGKGWFKDYYIQLMVIILCWMSLLTNKEYWDGQKTEMTYEVSKDAEVLRDEFFPIQMAAPKPSIFERSDMPGVSTASRFVKDEERPAA